jgi:tetratricopeptide (TPR) repeat protein
MSDMTRHQLKKNELEDFVLKSVDWIKNNRQLAGTVAGTVVFVLALAVFFFIRYNLVWARANDKLSFAQANFFQGKPEEGIKIFNEIIAQYPGTVADYQARMQKAIYLAETHNFTEAEQTIMPAVENGKPKTVLPLAASILGAVRENAGKYKEAAEAYNSFLDKYPEHFLSPKIYESLARIYEISGSTQDAKTTYEKIVTLYPASPWAQRAQQRITAVSNLK